MGNASKTNAEILKEIRQSGVQKVKVAVTDIDGVLRGKYLHLNKFESAFENGFGFCNVVFGWDCNDVCYDNVDYTGWHTGYPDAWARIDPATYRKIPWDDQTPFFLADFQDDKGGPLSICPRQLLKTIISRSREMGFEPMAGLEFEWFNFQETPQSLADKKYEPSDLKPLTPGMFGYSILRSSLNKPYFTALMDQLQDFNIPLEGLHTETGPGVFEGALVYTDALEAADRAVLFKTAVKEIAYSLNHMASFMARWNEKLPGCGGHIHQSLWDKQKSKNIFYDEKDPYKMSSLFKHYVAGQLHCLPEILPFYAPNVNSYRRLVEGYWAPTRAIWGCDNRTTALRVIPGSDKSTRLETRVAGADMNPYLAVAANIASGLYGIKNKLELKQAPFVGNAYKDKTAPAFPKNLEEAAGRMAESKIAKELFGDSFVEHFAKTRVWEARQAEGQDLRWELQRYFEII